MTNEFSSVEMEMTDVKLGEEVPYNSGEKEVVDANDEKRRGTKRKRWTDEHKNAVFRHETMNLPLTMPLFRYQRDFVGWALNQERSEGRRGGILADEKGMGKTIQAIALVLACKSKSQPEENGPTLVICLSPVTAYHWSSEINRCTYPGSTNVLSCLGNQKDDFDSFDFVLTTYSKVRGEQGQNIKSIKWKRIILDELTLDERRGINQAPTADPVLELESTYRWVLISSLHNLNLQPLVSFLHISADEERQNFILERTKAEFDLALPTKMISLRLDVLDSEESISYEQEFNSSRQKINRYIQHGRLLRKYHGNAVEILHRLRKFAVQRSTKLEALKEEISFMEARDLSSKAIVLSQFPFFLEMVNDVVIKSGFRCAKVVGDMYPPARDAAIESFREDPNFKFLLMTWKNGGAALDLTAASHVFMMDPWMSKGVEKQVEDNVHRIPQFKAVRIVKFILKNTVEERILQLQNEKEPGRSSDGGKEVISAEDIISLLL